MTVVPPNEQPGRNLRVGKQVGPDDHKAMRPKPTIDGEAVPQTGPGEPAALPAPGDRVITPSESDVVPPNEQPGRNLRVGKQVGPDDHKAMRPKPTIDGEAVPQTGPTDAEREANRQRVNNDRSAYTQQVSFQVDR